MSANDSDLVDQMAKKHSVSPAAVQVVLAALRSGGGRMAQFSHADLGGMSQWSPGMSMVGDMFNTQLKALDALCSDIAAHLDTSESAGGVRPEGVEVSYRSPTRSDDWWPAGLGRPAAVGAQNDLRYAVFPETRRLVIDDQGVVSVYDTGSHRIFGVAQAQSADRTLTLTSQDGLVNCGPAEGLWLTGVPGTSTVAAQLRHFQIFDRDDPAAFGCVRSFSHPSTDRPSNSGDAARSAATKDSNEGPSAVRSSRRAWSSRRFNACISSSRPSFAFRTADFMTRRVSS
jgi:hypothetical protein